MPGGRSAWVRALTALGMSLVGWSAVAAPPPAPAESACRVSGLRTEVRCGAVSRPLDASRTDSPRIQVHYVRVPAVARHAEDDPVVFLAGGPGQSAIALAPQLMPLLSRLNQRRDLLFVDQRGTGRSAPLPCALPDRASVAQMNDAAWQTDQLLTCLGQLRGLPHGDLSHYTTEEAMADLDAVRQAVGAPALNLVAGSYGTRAALSYLRQFPHAVRRVVLDGVVPPDMAMPASQSPDAQRALDALFDACEAEAACQARHPNLRADWESLLARLPWQATVQHPLTGATETWPLTRPALLAAVRGPLYVPALASALPHALSQAAQGRLEPLAGLNSVLWQRRGSELALGMHFSVVCAEDLPRLSQRAESPGRDFGRDTEALYRAVCAQWPTGKVSDAFYTVPPSPVPVLLSSGEFDPVTPPRHGDRVAQALGPRARHVVVPNAGHGTLGVGCMREVLNRFVEAPDARAAHAVDATCLSGIPRPPVFQPVGARPVAP